MGEKNSVAGLFLDNSEINTTTFKEQAYKLIKEAIIYHKFKPDEIYSQESICNELGISITPVREALLELQKEGYIQFLRGRGILIVSMNKKDIKEILEMRIYQEMISAELAAKNAKEDDIKHIEQSLKKSRHFLESQDIALCYKFDHDFHRSIARASNNNMLYHLIDNILDLYLRFEVLTIYESLIEANKIWEEHNNLFNAIKEGNPEQAKLASRTHLENSFKRTLGNYWKNK